MNLLAPLISIPVALALGSGALVHAASENGILLSSNRALLEGGLTAEAVSETVDGGFRRELSKSASPGLTGIGTASDTLIALARSAFVADPLEVSTIRTIALGHVLPLDEVRARRLMHIAAQVSKRDAMTNLWLAQDYGQLGDLPEMMAAFDHALRTSAGTREVAMEPLVNLLADTACFAPLGDLLKQQPEWETAFWTEFSRNPRALEMAEDFFDATSLPLERLNAGTRANLFSNLKSEGRFEAIFELAAHDPAARPSADVTSTDFSLTEDGDPLGWALHSQGNYSASVHGASRELQIDALAGSFGLVAERLVLLGGDQEVNIQMAEPVPENASLKLVVSCAGSNDILKEVELRSAEKMGAGRFASRSCAYGTLRLSLNVDPGRRDAFLRIKNITLSDV